MSSPNSNHDQGQIDFMELVDSEPSSSPAPSVTDVERAVSGIIRALDGFTPEQVDDILGRAGNVARRRAGG
jgi:hypothetical protein